MAHVTISWRHGSSGFLSLRRPIISLAYRFRESFKKSGSPDRWRCMHET
uniref:Uncharacterized protein n=1 Tax=Arundo donax TaxID=35708 RepID=A0A0A9EQ04_ARUDO